MLGTMIRPTLEDHYRQAQGLDEMRSSNAGSELTLGSYLYLVLAAIVCGVLVAAVNKGWM